MRITLPGGVVVDWGPAEIAEALHSLADALPAAIAEVAKPPPGGSLLGDIELIEPDRLRFRATIHRLPPSQWEFLGQLIQAGGACDYATIGEELWADDAAPRNRIDQAATKLRRTLRRLRIPLTITTHRQVAKLVRSGT